MMVAWANGRLSLADIKFKFKAAGELTARTLPFAAFVTQPMLNESFNNYSGHGKRCITIGVLN